jgi:hypothetical protein
MIKLIIFLDNLKIISKLEEETSELGEPDCRLVDPFIVKNPQILDGNPTLEPWLSDFSKQNIFMIHSDKILTIAEPNAKLKELYEDLTK